MNLISVPGGTSVVRTYVDLPRNTTAAAQRLSLTQIPIRSRGVGLVDRIEDAPSGRTAAVWNDTVRRQIIQLVSTPEYEDILRPVVERMEKLQPVHCLKEFVNQKVGLAVDDCMPRV